MGIGRGERVIALVENEPRFLLTWFGLSRLGACFVPLDPAATEAELAGILRRVRPRLIVGRGDRLSAARLAPRAAEVGAEIVDVDDVTDPAGATPHAASPTAGDDVRADDLGVLLPTSGTTGAGKIVMQTQRAFVLAGEAFPSWIGLDSADRVGISLPLFHLNALAYSTLGAVAAGATIVLLPRFSASRFLDDVRAAQVTQFNAVGAMLEILVRRPPRPDDADTSLRLCYAAPAPATRARHLEIEQRFGMRITAGYGLSESPFGTIWPRTGPRPFGSLGALRQHPRLGKINEGRVVDDAGRVVSDGAVGELLLRNPALMQGYLEMPQETADALRDGWLHTGDLVRRDGNGIFVFVARKKDIIRRRGENISPGEIEEALLGEPDIVEAAVVAVPGDLGEDEVKAFVVIRRPLDPDALVRSLRLRLSRHKLPRYVEVVSNLPRTATRRVAKHLLTRERTAEEVELQAEP